MKISAKRAISLILISLMALGTLSCGESENSGDETSKSNTESSSENVDSDYVYPSVDLNNDTFTILNTAQTYGFYSNLDFEESSGETLDDSIYDRNRFLEDKFNFRLIVNEEYALDEAAQALRTSVLADDGEYDVAFIRDYYLTSLISEGHLVDLDTISEIQFDQPWWDGAATEAARVGSDKKAFVAATDISLVDFEGTIVNFVNEDMLADLKLDSPYDLVREGKWTFDKQVEYMKAAANLNGDDNFVPFNVNGSSIYGMVGFQHTYNALISSAGVEYVSTDKDGDLIFGADTEKFYNVAIKISETFSNDGDWLYANYGQTTDPIHYEMIFKSGRSLFLSAQLKAANNYRDMDAAYGLLPVAKWDESQENYSCLRTFSYLMVIPVTNDRTSETGAIMDAMSYLTYTDIMPYFYNGRVSQKLLRNDDSIEMLDIIRESRHYDIGTIYGSFGDVSNEISALINAKSTDFASKIASIKPSIEKNLATIMENIG